MRNKYSRNFGYYSVDFYVVDDPEEEELSLCVHLRENLRGVILDEYANEALAISDYIVNSKVAGKQIRWLDGVADLLAKSSFLKIGGYYIGKKDALDAFGYIYSVLWDTERNKRSDWRAIATSIADKDRREKTEAQAPRLSPNL
jgi:hypothetical protein